MSEDTEGRIEFAKEFATLIADVKYIRETISADRAAHREDITTLRNICDNQEKRLRALEEWRWKMVGAALAGGAGGAGLFKAITAAIGGS